MFLNDNTTVCNSSCDMNPVFERYRTKGGWYRTSRVHTNELVGGNPNMCIFLKSSNRALHRRYHFSHAPTTQLGAPGAGSWHLPESEHKLCTKCENWAFRKVQKHLWGCFGHPKVFFDHTFQIWTDLVKILRGFSSFCLISVSEDLWAISWYKEVCSTAFLLFFVKFISKVVLIEISPLRNSKTIRNA